MQKICFNVCYSSMIYNESKASTIRLGMRDDIALGPAMAEFGYLTPIPIGIHRIELSKVSQLTAGDAEREAGGLLL